MKTVPLSEVKDDLSKFLRLAETEQIVITRHGKPAGVLIGFGSEDDWFEYRLVITAALERAGFVRDELLEGVMFRDGAEGKPSEAVHLLFAGEKTRPDHLLPAPEIQTINDPANFPVITLESLVLMKLMSNRRKDQVHVQDLIGVGLIDQSWLTKLPPELASRLKLILDTPDA